jgi:three-Cys-motif partner protein
MDYIIAYDNLEARIVKIWSEEKLDYLKRYIYAFTTSLKNKFPEINYIDLFCGPGKNYIKGDDRYVDGSPIIALKTLNPFDNYIFNDSDEKIINVLKNRTSKFKSKIHFLNKDCNEILDDILDIINPNSRNLLFIDPTGIDLHFNTLKSLSEKITTDILMLFPFGIGIKRNAKQMIKTKNNKFLKFIGILDINELLNRLEIFNDNVSLISDKDLDKKILDLYINQMSKINYDKIKNPDFVPIRNKQNVIMYHLIFASKVNLGHKIWGEIRSKRATGQRDLGL